MPHGRDSDHRTSGRAGLRALRPRRETTLLPRGGDPRRYRAELTESAGMLPCSVRQVLALSARAAEVGRRILGGASSKLRKLAYLRLMIGGRSERLICINSVSSKNLNIPFRQSELSASSTTSVLARANLLTSLFSPDELRRMHRGECTFRNCPKRATSNAPGVHLTSIWRTIQAEE